MNQKSFKFAFTLAEVMVCLAVLSILATILLPTLTQYKPNNNRALFKKSYEIVERVVVEMVNDNDLYQTLDGVVGFDNLDPATYQGQDYGTVVSAGGAYNRTEGNAKFCRLFAAKINVVSGAPVCTDATAPNSSGNVPWADGVAPISTRRSFITSDGIVWSMPYSNFTGADNPAWKVIWVDVNGDKGPNIADTASDASVCSQDIDRFPIYVRADGKVGVNSACAREYLNELSLITNRYSSRSNRDLRANSAENISVGADQSAAHVAGTNSADEWYNNDSSAGYNPSEWESD